MHYFRLALVPTGLVLDYDWRPSSMAQAALPVALIGVALAVTIAGVVRRRPAAFAAAWCFLVLAPSSSVIPIVTEVAAEHRMYLPVAGVMALLVMTSFAAGYRLTDTEQSRRMLGRMGLLAAGAVIVLFGAMTYARNADYHDYDRIWSDTIAKRPHNARARNNYATSLLMNGRYADAEQHLRVAVEERPDFAEAEGNLGVALASLGRLEEGATHLRRAIALRPDDAGAHRNLGENYMLQHRPGDAVAELSKALEYRPDNVDVLNRAAWILATTTDGQTRDGARARAFAERAVALTGRRQADSLDNLAVALAEIGQFDQATTVTLEAISVARSSGQAALVPELEQRLIAYRAHQPIRVR
jgi:Flp pilus assembly protein TadD